MCYKDGYQAVHTRFRQDCGDCGPRSSYPSHSLPFLPLMSCLGDPQSQSAKGDGIFSGLPLSSTPPQLPPTTNGSSSGTLGCPTRITSSRLGEAVDWSGAGRTAAGRTAEGRTAGGRVVVHDSVFLTRRQPAPHAQLQFCPLAPLSCCHLPR